MLRSPGLERTARFIAENVASAVEHDLDKGAIHPLMREVLVVELLRALLPAMPTRSGAVPVDARNRHIDHFAGFRMTGPRVEAVDLEDGSATMMAGRSLSGPADHAAFFGSDWDAART